MKTIKPYICISLSAIFTLLTIVNFFKMFDDMNSKWFFYTFLNAIVGIVAIVSLVKHKKASGTEENFLNTFFIP